MKIKLLFLSLGLLTFSLVNADNKFAQLNNLSSQFVKDDRWHELSDRQQQILINIFNRKFNEVLQTFKAHQEDLVKLNETYNLLYLIAQCSLYNSSQEKESLIEYLLLEGVSVTEDALFFIDRVLLLRHGVDPNFRLSNGDTWLIALFKIRTEWLVKNSMLDSQGHNYVLTNTICYFKEIINSLMQYGANPNLTDNDGKTAFDHFIEYAKSGCWYKESLEVAKALYGNNIPSHVRFTLNKKFVQEFAEEKVAPFIVQASVLSVEAYALYLLAQKIFN